MFSYILVRVDNGDQHYYQVFTFKDNNGCPEHFW